jgi:hypothetical protein
VRPSGGHHLFAASDPAGTPCPVCKWPLVFRKARRVYMWPIGPRVRNILRHPILSRSLEDQFQRVRRGDWYDDATGGSLYAEFRARTGLQPGFAHKGIAWKISNDPMAVTDYKSVTPVFATPMSIPKKIREKVSHSRPVPRSLFRARMQFCTPYAQTCMHTPRTAGGWVRAAHVVASWIQTADFSAETLLRSRRQRLGCAGRPNQRRTHAIHRVGRHP